MNALTCTQEYLQTRYDYSESDLDRDRASFLAYLRQSGRRETTVETYYRALGSIYRVFASEGALPAPQSITPNDFVHLRQVLKVCDSSKKLYLIVLGRFCRYFTGKNPREDAELPS